MKRTKLIAGLLTCCLIAGTATACSAPGSKASEPTIHPWLNEELPMEDMDEYGGADSAAGAYNHADSPYFAHPDFYNMKSNDHLTILENFETSQQTNEWSCGDNAILMAFHHLGIDKYTEYDIAKATKTSTDEDVPDAEPGTYNNWPELGANIGKLMSFLENCPEIKVVETNYKASYSADELVSADDVAAMEYSPYMEGNAKKYFSANALYTTDNDPASENWVEDAADAYFVKWIKGHLEANEPIIVHTSSWNGHFAVIIGYDTMGTPALGDDMLILADSYDTADHWQDGYVYYQVEKWFYEWDDLNVAAKPYQLQPFIVIGSAE